LLGYVVGINDFGTFVKFGTRKDSVLLVNINEYGDDVAKNTPIVNQPVLVKVIQTDPKLKGTMRKSLITEDLFEEP